MAHKKLNLPDKVCLKCDRPFSWRKKWSRDWDQVRYCSQRCKQSRNQDSPQSRMSWLLCKRPV